MNDAIKDWLQTIGHNDDFRIQVLKDLLTHASEDDMNEDDKIICLASLQKLSGFDWEWKERETSRDTDVITCVTPMTVN